MPELPVKEVRPSELHLPEIKRDDIVRALSDMKMPDVKLPDVDLTNIERPNVDKASKSLARIATAAAVALHLAPRRQSRWPFAIGGLIVAGVAVAVLTNEVVRARLVAGATAIRDRMTAMRSASDDTLDVGTDVVAFDAAETAKIEDSPFTDATPIDATGYPAGLGIDQDGNPSREEARAGD